MTHVLPGWVLASALLLTGRPAEAVYSCGGKTDTCQCAANNPYPCCSNGGNCTWWAWHSACCNWKVGLPPWGNAKEWAGNAKAHPAYVVKSAPVPNSIAVRVSSSYGHVAWVKSVSGSQVVVTEMGCWGWYGVRTTTYSASYFDGGFIVQKTPCACVAGATETKACGDCGTRKRTCTSSCQWGSWGGCSGEGVCSAGATETRTCGVCAERARTCGSGCTWGEWGDCLTLDGGTCDPGLWRVSDMGAEPDRSVAGPGPREVNGTSETPLVGGCQVGAGATGSGPMLLLLLALICKRLWSPW